MSLKVSESPTFRIYIKFRFNWLYTNRTNRTKPSANTLYSARGQDFFFGLGAARCVLVVIFGISQFFFFSKDFQTYWPMNFTNWPLSKTGFAQTGQQLLPGLLQLQLLSFLPDCLKLVNTKTTNKRKAQTEEDLTTKQFNKS